MHRFQQHHGPTCGNARWRLAAVVAIASVWPSLSFAGEPSFVFIPAADQQPTGPAHDYRITRYEIRNDEFVAFLNDALTNPGNERGEHLYFDTASGDVYLNTSTTGGSGVGSSERSVRMFTPSIAGQIEFVGGAYAVALAPVDFTEHPVVGVTWFGAVKYCNWLTVSSGLSPGDRAYSETPAPDLDGWHPVTTTSEDWAVGDLNAVDRAALIKRVGFRLPMDDGVPGASSYSEWYKAAAWDEAGQVNHTFGFGRDSLGGSDANYRSSGDPFDPGSTPVGYYDGSDHGGAFATTANDNGYQAFDFSGNVWEWVQDQSPTDVGRRRTRGGSWRSFTSSLELTFEGDASVSFADVAIGFRVVQSVIDPLLITPFAELSVTGPWGGTYDPPGDSTITYSLRNVVDVPVVFTATTSAAWIAVEPGFGVVQRGAVVDVVVTIEPGCADGLTVGSNADTVVFALDNGTTVAERSVTLQVREPLSLAPVADFVSTLEFSSGSPSPSNTFYSFTNASIVSVNWSARWVDTSDVPAGRSWLLLGGAATSTGSVPPRGVWPIVVGIDGSEASQLSPGLYTADVTLTDDCTGRTFVRAVRLDVTAPLIVTPEVPTVLTGVSGGPFDPTGVAFDLQNGFLRSITWTAELCVESPGAATCTPPVSPTWLTLDRTGNTLVAEAVDRVLVDLTPGAANLEAGIHVLTVRFTDVGTGLVVDRQVILDVTGIAVEPSSDVTFRGPLGGPFQPSSLIYTVRNAGRPEMNWAAQVVFDPPLIDLGNLNWLTVAPSSGVIFDKGDVDEVTISLSSDAVQLDPDQSYSATITFTADNNAATSATRRVTLIVGSESFSVSMMTVPGADAQPLGPDYTFRLGEFEVRNSEFARFLNNARRNAIDPTPGIADARSAFMYFDRDSGDVYINDQAAGEEGGDPAGVLTTRLFRAAVSGEVSFVNNEFVVSTGKENFPVVGVSWYGAVKFCNWLTLLSGMDPGQRAYVEGTSPAAWIAVAPAATLTERRGFRLPMDDGAAAASAFNEWYKGAAWRADLSSDTVYGFGRDTLTSTDANYRESGDAHEPGSSPVGFFTTENGYRLFDMTGNVAEWMHDAGVTSADRATRGGHYNNVVDSPFLKNDGRSSVPADQAFNFVGFRVAQVVAPVELDVVIDPVSARGFVGEPLLSSGTQTINVTITNPSEQTIDQVVVSVSPDWFEVDGIAPTQIPAGASVVVPFRVSPSGLNAGVSPAPPGDFTLVLGSEQQSEGLPGAEVLGPTHDFWISEIEVTNSSFVSFLNGATVDAQRDAPSIRSEYMYFDTGSGSVYVNDARTPAIGTTVPIPGTMMYDGGVGRIQLVGGTYVVDAGFAAHPVVGVTWYGAIKYCNWLTIETGLPPSLRAYEEAPSHRLDGWHPVVITDSVWTTTGLPDAARRFLVEDTLGYRLPMDDGATTASPHNEWYKAASRTDGTTNTAPIFGSVYGFGRDVLTSADANFFKSGDTATDGTTSVRFFDGTNNLFQEPSTGCFGDTTEATPTADTANGYHLFDLTGNVAEWMQDLGTDIADRATRGGGWRDASTQSTLRTDTRIAIAPDVASDDVGFRVVRGTGHVVTFTVTDTLADSRHDRQFILDLREPLQLTPLTDESVSGGYGDLDVFSTITRIYTLTNKSSGEMNWSIASDAPWLDVRGPVVGELSGTIAGDGVVELDLATNALADDLGPGNHSGTLEVTNVVTGGVHRRMVELSIDEPISSTTLDVDPQPFSGPLGGPFDAPVLDRSFRFVNDAAFDLSYEITSDRTWLTLTSALTGTLAGGGDVTVTATVGADADVLAVGKYDANVNLLWTDLAASNLSSAVSQLVRLIVEDPVAITQSVDPWPTQINPDPSEHVEQVFTLTNRTTTPVELMIDVDVTWIDVDQTVVEVLPGLPVGATVRAVLNDNASALVDGVYVGTISWTDTITNIKQCSVFELTINEGLSVTPFADFLAFGATGRAAVPSISTYQVTNVPRVVDGGIDWTVSTSANWLTVIRTTDPGVLLDDGSSAGAVVLLNPDAVALLPAGVHRADVEISDLTGGTSQLAAVRTVVLTLTDAILTPNESTVSAAITQPGGPGYGYVMGTFHTTNAEFVSFLNDARANFAGERGQYMFFDSTAGDVYVNTMMNGSIGADPGGRTTKMFAPAAANQIAYVGGVYEVITTPTDFSRHPVAGVSWYGAVKYCNWLTLDQGMPSDQRCYTESTDASLAGWRPVVVTKTNWIARDLTDSERQSLVTKYRGYRLPMDDGAANFDPSTDGVDGYNEWYKVAAWDAVLRNNRYGFGPDPDPLTGAFANYRCSEDPFESSLDCLAGGTTPVGFFDGVNMLADGVTVTVDTANAFGLYDLSGNLYQWVQGRFTTSADVLRRGTIRGGSFNSVPIHIEAGFRQMTPPDTTDVQVGYRVVRAVPTASGDINYDGVVDVRDYAGAAVCLSGPANAQIPGCEQLDVNGDGRFDLLDIATMFRDFTGNP